MWDDVALLGLTVWPQSTTWQDAARRHTASRCRHGVCRFPPAPTDSPHGGSSLARSPGSPAPSTSVVDDLEDGGRRRPTRLAPRKCASKRESYCLKGSQTLKVELIPIMTPALLIMKKELQTKHTFTNGDDQMNRCLYYVKFYSS